MKLVQHKYVTIQRVEIELKQIGETVDLPIIPRKCTFLIADSSLIVKDKNIEFSDENGIENNHIIELTSEKVLEIIESSYPNPVTIHDLAE